MRPASRLAVSVMTSEGRITIPKQIRDQLRLEPGHQVEFQVDRQGQATMRPHNRDFHSLKGMIRSRRKTPVSVEEMNEAIARGWSGT